MLASPYAVDLPRYYAGMLGGHDFSALVVEWAPATPGLMTAPFYALAFAAVALLARRRSASSFEQLALAVTLAGGMLAVRNMVWFSLTAMVVLPRLLALELPAEKGEAGRAVKVGLPLAAAVLSAAVLAAVVTRPAAWYDRSAGAGSVAEAVAANPGLPLLAPLDDADRLLWEEPGLRARIAYDARLELLSDDELRRVYEWQNRIGDWPSIAGCPALALVDAAHARELPRARTLQRDASGSLLLLNCAE